MNARQWLVVPLLSPLLAVVLVAALNPSPALSFRILTWVSPRAPLGLWLGGAALGGAALSGAGTALALRQSRAPAPRGRRRVATTTSRPWGQMGSQDDGGWEPIRSESRPPRREGPRRESWPASQPDDDFVPQSWRQVTVGVAPTRSPGEPPPTVDVPFRILHRPSQPAPSFVEREPVSVAGQDDWGSEVGADDW